MRPRTPHLVGVAAVVVFGVLGGGCPRGGGDGPKVTPRAPWTVSVETAGVASADAVAVAADGRVAAVVTAAGAAAIGGREIANAGSAVVALTAAGELAWARAIGAKPTAVAFAGEVVVAGVGGSGMLGEITLRGEPGAALVGLAAADGADRWVVPVGSTEWCVIRAVVAAAGGDVVAVGSFAGTIRAGDRVVTSAGASDGFAARLGGDGAVRWLMRIGGEGADAITAVAATPDGVVVGGTFSGHADARGVALAPIAFESIAPDAFVARLDDDGLVIWAQPFGGESDDAVAGVAVTTGGTIGVAATLRGEVVVDDKPLTTRGLADAALLTFDESGNRRATVLLGGDDYDTASALTALGDRFVVGATYAGQMSLADTRLDGDGGDGGLIAIVDPTGVLLRVHDVSGPGRETIPALAATPAGWVAALRHTAGASLDGATLAPPTDPYGGAALAFRSE